MKAAFPIFMGMTWSMGAAIRAAIYVIILVMVIDAIRWAWDVFKKTA